MSIAICPGSFDPITVGHLNIICRASKIFDEVIVCVMVNARKTAQMFSPEEKADMARRATEKYPNVRVECYDGLLAEFAAKYPGAVVVKGLRAVSDFEYEFQMNQVNKTINPDLETMFLTAEGKYTFLSSSVVRELAIYGASLEGLVPDEIIGDIKERAALWRKA